MQQAIQKTERCIKMTDRKNSIIIGRACTGKTQNFIVPTIKYVCTNNKENMVVISPKDDIKEHCLKKLQEYGYNYVDVSVEEAQSKQFFTEYYKDIPEPNVVFISGIGLIEPEVTDKILFNFMNMTKITKHDHIRIFIDEANIVDKISNLPEFIETSKANAYSVMMATQSVNLLENGRTYSADEIINGFETVIFTDEKEKKRYSETAV